MSAHTHKFRLQLPRIVYTPDLIRIEWSDSRGLWAADWVVITVKGNKQQQQQDKREGFFFPSLFNLSTDTRRRWRAILRFSSVCVSSERLASYTNVKITRRNRFAFQNVFFFLLFSTGAAGRLWKYCYGFSSCWIGRRTVVSFSNRNDDDDDGLLYPSPARRVWNLSPSACINIYKRLFNSLLLLLLPVPPPPQSISCQSKTTTTFFNRICILFCSCLGFGVVENILLFASQLWRKKKKKNGVVRIFQRCQRFQRFLIGTYVGMEMADLLLLLFHFFIVSLCIPGRREAGTIFLVTMITSYWCC